MSQRNVFICWIKACGLLTVAPFHGLGAVDTKRFKGIAVPNPMVVPSAQKEDQHATRLSEKKGLLVEPLLWFPRRRRGSGLAALHSPVGASRNFHLQRRLSKGTDIYHPGHLHGSGAHSHITLIRILWEVIPLTLPLRGALHRHGKKGAKQITFIIFANSPKITGPRCRTP